MPVSTSLGDTVFVLLGLLGGAVVLLFVSRNRLWYAGLGVPVLYTLLQWRVDAVCYLTAGLALAIVALDPFWRRRREWEVPLLVTGIIFTVVLLGAMHSMDPPEPLLIWLPVGVMGVGAAPAVA